MELSCRGSDCGHDTQKQDRIEGGNVVSQQFTSTNSSRGTELSWSPGDSRKFSACQSLDTHQVVRSQVRGTIHLSGKCPPYHGVQGGYIIPSHMWRVRRVLRPGFSDTVFMFYFLLFECAEVRGQICGVSSLLPPLHEFQRRNTKLSGLPDGRW